jgi:hypothetical protein
MRKAIFFLFLSLCTNIHANAILNAPPNRKVSIIGGGIIGALESYSAYQDAQKNEKQICITVFEKGESFATSEQGNASTNTSYNIVPSLTIDEILSVPRGSEMVKKLTILFSNPGGMRVDDVVGINESIAAINFKEAVALYSLDKNHDDRTHTLLKLGKMSMDLWQEMYDHADDELKGILEASNFNPCREPRNGIMNSLHDGYRVDLIYGIPDAKMLALSKQANYEKLGYKNCKILSPDEVLTIDPYLADFCNDHSELNDSMHRNWKNDSIALWLPGGCIDTRVFLPKFYNYLKKIMGQYRNDSGKIEDCFSLKFNSEVIGVELDSDLDNLRINGLKFSNGSQVDNGHIKDSWYIFCPGEAVGTLSKLGFTEPAYAGFAGASLLLNIPILPEQFEIYKNFSHCMEVYKEGIGLAWQARVKENKIFIGVAGTKAFYGDQLPNKNEAFAKNRNLVQLNMINNVLPEFISLALGYNTHGKELSPEELETLETQGILQRWVGRRSVAYDGFPTFGYLYINQRLLSNARCTTHLGSGGVSFAPAAVEMSRSSEKNTDNAFIKKVLMYSDSRRIAKEK